MQLAASVNTDITWMAWTAKGEETISIDGEPVSTEHVRVDVLPDYLTIIY